jgi:hypothetical protein
MADFKTLVSDVIDLTDTAEYFEFDTQGFTTISFGVEYSTGTPSACYVQLQYSSNGRDFDIAKTRKYSDDSLAAISFIDETLREFQTHGRPISHKVCRIKVKTAESAAATGRITVYLGG